MSEQVSLTSLAIVVMKAGGRAVAIRESAWRAERAESAGGLRGKPMVILRRETETYGGFIQRPKNCFSHPKHHWVGGYQVIPTKMAEVHTSG